MNVTYEPKARRVIPNWRYFIQTAGLGELDAYDTKNLKDDDYSIDGYIIRWMDKKNVYNAGDLISAAISNNQRYNPKALEAAKYILEKNLHDNVALNKTAQFIVNSSQEYSQEMAVRLDDVKDKLKTIQDVQSNIHHTRILLRLYPFNPILYVDMARFYLMVGQTVKAIKMMRIALLLAKDNRFISRSAARLYIHLGDFDHAHYILCKTGAVKYDPWIMASEISVSMLMQKSSAQIKRGIEIVKSRNFTPFSITELSSSLGTFEMFYSRKKSRNLFQLSLVEPNENSLAQAEWASKLIPIHLDKVNRTSVKCDFEAQAYAAIEQNDMKLALEKIVDWICDMPFSKKPVLLGSFISNTFFKNYQFSEKILSVGVKANPQDTTLLNDMAYVLARQNKIAEAYAYMERLDTALKKSSNEKTKSIEVCKLATQGLIAFRQGIYDKGIKKYEEAISLAKKNEHNDPITYTKAILNYAREQMLASAVPLNNVKTKVESLTLPNEDVSLEFLRKEIIDIYEQKSKYC